MKQLFIFISILIFSFQVYAQPKPENQPAQVRGTNPRLTLPPEKSHPVTVPLIVDSPVIDGNVDEEVWKQAAVFKDFIQTGPGDNIEPSKPTEAFMMYDEKNLYIAFKCWDDRDKIRATVAKRDSVFGEDNVRVWLDTFDDQRRAYILGWNPLGIQADGIFTEGQGGDFSLDIVMESKGVIHDWGWSVEVKIPFKSLRYAAGEGKMWGFNVARNIDRFNDEFDSWMPDDRNISGFLIKHGKITGLNGIKTERTLELVPSITVSETGRRVSAQQIINGVPDNSGRFVNQPIETDLSLNLKYTITPNITIDAAINPDFAEIEADAPVILANQRFPIFFSEKRPFFLEGNDIFQSPIRVFNSRSIVDPDLALKVTGKIGRTSFGVLAATDNAPGNYDNNARINPNVRPFIDEFVDRNALFAVVRVKRDIGKENNIGFFGTMRVFPENRNFVGGFDGRFKIDAKTVFSFQAVGSHSRKCFFDPFFDDAVEPVQAVRNGEICGGGIVAGQQVLGNIYSRYRTGNGIAYTANWDHTADTSGYTFEVGGQSKDYRSDAGFNRRSNINYLFGGFRKSSKSRPDAAIVRANWFNGFSYAYDWDGRAADLEYNSNLNLNLQKNAFVNFWGGITKENIYEDEFGLSRTPNRDGAFFDGAKRKTTQVFFGGFFRQQLNKQFSYAFDAGLNFNSFDFDFGAGPRYPRVSAAYRQYLIDRITNPDLDEPGLDPGPGRRLNLSANLEYAPIDPLRIEFNYDRSTLVRNDTGQTSFDVNIFSLRSTYQFTRFTFVRARWDYNTLSSRVDGQMLVGWNPNPGTAFYVGYNDSLTYNGFNPFTGALEPNFARSSRTFFIRASYLFRKSF